MRRAPAILMLLFFVVVIFHKTQPILMTFGIPPVNFFGFGIFAIAPVFFVWGFALHRRENNRPLLPGGAKHPLLVFYLLAIVLLGIYGWLSGNIAVNVVYDLWVFLVALLFAVASMDSQWLDRIIKPLIVVYWIAFGLVCRGLSRVREHLSAEGFGLDSFDGRGTATLAYEMSPVLDFWPLLFSYSVIRPKGDIWKWLGIGSFVAYIGLQIYFQKRAPTARAASYFLLAVCYLSVLSPSWVVRKHARRAAIVCLVSMLALVSYISIDGLSERYRRKDSSRFDEIAVMLSQMDEAQLLLGKGMGGYFQVGRLRFDAGSVVVGSNGEVGKTLVHIGLFVLVLKGGVLFLLLHLILVGGVLVKFRNQNWLRIPVNLMAICILPVYILFRGIEGWFSTGMVFDAVVFGFCIGRSFATERPPTEFENTSKRMPRRSMQSRRSLYGA